MKLSIFAVVIALTVVMNLTMVIMAHSSQTNVVKHTVAKDPDTTGFWKKKTIWKSRWVKYWRPKLIYVPVWKNVWGPVYQNEWVPLPNTPQGGWQKANKRTLVRQSDWK